MEIAPYSSHRVSVSTVIPDTGIAPDNPPVAVDAVETTVVVPTDVSTQAKKLAVASIVLGIIGIFIMGIPLGWAAIYTGSRAEKMGARAGKAGVVLGGLDVFLAILVLLVMVSG